MVVISKSLRISSSSNFQIIDISRDITAVLNEINKEHKMDNGIVNIFENEKGLLLDFEKALKDVIKEKDNYKHDFIDNNAASHIRAFFLGSSETIPIVDGRLDLGTWQSIFFIELDGPRPNRTVDLTFIVD